MKNSILFLFVIVVFCSLLNSVIWEIKQDGTGNFITIQEGINASTNGDTVLVYPGTYYENLYIENKNITLASLDLTTGNSQYIYSTIIDGQGNGSCIWIRYCNIGTIIQGFKIINGAGTLLQYTSYGVGGGIKCSSSVAQIISNKVNTNTAWGGGGIFISNSEVLLSNNDIYNNYSSIGGGIYIDFQCSITFDSIKKNSIYNNYASNGYDLYALDTGYIYAIVDTFSVLIPDCYFAKAFDPYPNPNTVLVVEVDYGLNELKPYDLYVAVDGDDSNSGLSFDEPLRNISTAVRLIDVSGGVNRTIHVASGTYSYNTNQQIFPFGFKENLSIIGEDKLNTFVTHDFLSDCFVSLDINGYNVLENFSFSVYSGNSYSLAAVAYSNNFRISNCIFTGNSGDNFIFLASSNNIILNNLYIHNATTTESEPVTLFLANGKMDNVTIENCSMISQPEYSASTLDILVKNEFIVENCSIINCSGYNSTIGNVTFRDNPGSITNKIITNCLFANNTSLSDYNVLIYGIGSQSMSNCTFVDNNSLYSTLQLRGNLDLSNSIFSNPTNAFEIYIPNPASGLYSVLNISYCDILGGESSVYNFNTALNTVNWLDGNIDADPLFLGTGEHPYQLSELSPCIDAGTLDMPFGFSLPAYDLAGNPRVMGSAIDIGAYEFPDNPAPIYLQMDNETLFWQIPPGCSPTGYNVYLDESFQAYVGAFSSQYTFSNLIFGETYQAGVSALYNAEETAVIPLQFVYEPVGIEEETTYLSPLSTHISNYPNPFNPSTTISFSIEQHEQNQQVELSIFNIKGQKVKTLIDAVVSATEISCVWNGKDENGKRVSSGEYIARLTINGEEKAVRKMMVVK